MKAPFSRKNPSGGSREHPRFSTRRLQRISVRLKKDGKVFRVANVSAGGIGLFCDEMEKLLLEAESVEAILEIENKSLPIGFRLVHLASGLAGCKFINPDSELVSSIEHYFKTELAALRLNMVESKDDSSGIKTIFFHGQNNCELLVYEANGVITSCTVILFGNYLEIDAKGNSLIGESFHLAEAIQKKGVKLFKPIQNWDRQLSTIALRFVENIELLSAERKAEVLKLLSKLPSEQSA